MKVDLCDLKRLFRADFFTKDRDVSLQANRSFFLGSGTKISDSNLIPDGAIVFMFSGAIVDIPTDWQLADGTNGTTDLRNMFVVGAGDTYNPGDTGGADTDDISHDHGDGSYAAANDTHGHSINGNSGGGTDHTHGDGSYAAANDTHNHGPGTLSTTTASNSADLGGSGVSGTLQTHTHDVTAGTTANDTHNHNVTGTSAIESSHTHGDGSYTAANDTHNHDVTGTSATGGDAAHDNRPSFYALAFIMRPT